MNALDLKVNTLRAMIEDERRSVKRLQMELQGALLVRTPRCCFCAPVLLLICLCAQR